MSAREALAMLGLSVEEVEEAVAEAKARRENPERHICICGHPKARHYIDKDNPEIVVCKPARWGCECGKYHAVLQVQDTRDFLYGTDGPAKQHALSKGIVNALLKQHGVEWLEGTYACSFCETTKDLTIYPFAGSEKQGWRIARDKEEDTNMGKRNAFVCDTCAEKM